MMKLMLLAFASLHFANKMDKGLYLQWSPRCIGLRFWNWGLGGIADGEAADGEATASRIGDGVRRVFTIVLEASKMGAPTRGL